jgi:hypothetical protein
MNKGAKIQRLPNFLITATERTISSIAKWLRQSYNSLVVLLRRELTVWNIQNFKNIVTFVL